MSGRDNSSKDSAMLDLDKATFEELLANPGFKAHISMRQQNRHEPHDSEAANAKSRQRIASALKNFVGDAGTKGSA